MPRQCPETAGREHCHGSEQDNEAVQERGGHPAHLQPQDVEQHGPAAAEEGQQAAESCQAHKGESCTAHEVAVGRGLYVIKDTDNAQHEMERVDSDHNPAGVGCSRARHPQG